MGRLRKMGILSVIMTYKKWEELSHRQKRRKMNSSRGCGDYMPSSLETTLYFSGVFVIVIILIIIGIK